MYVTGSRIRFWVMDAEGAQLTVEVTIRFDTVEFAVEGRNMAVMHRAVLRSWLGLPQGLLSVDEVTLAPARNGVRLTCEPLVTSARVPNLVLMELQARL